MITGRKIPVVAMDKQEIFSKIGAPIFDGTNYAFWKVRMRVYLMAQSFEVWNSVVTSYSTTTNPPIAVARRKLVDNNVKSMNAYYLGLYALSS